MQATAKTAMNRATGAAVERSTERATLGELLSNAGAELAALAVRGHGLQPLMERAIASAAAEADIRDAQDLDKLVQALEEMAGFFHRLAASPASDVEVEVRRLREGILLGDLQRRLFSNEPSGDVADPGELDLF